MSFLSKMVRAAGKGISGTVKVVTTPTRLAGKVVAKIPVVGKPLQTVINMPSAPLRLVDSIAKGDRLDKAVIDHIKGNIKDVKEVGPYAQMVVTLVPGVGTVAGGAIGAGLALSNGQPITKAITEGIKGSLPGGTVGVALFNAASGAIQGKSLTQIGLSALPVSDDVKKAITATLALAKDVSQGKNVANSLMKQAEKNLPADARKALAVGLAVAQGQKIQSAIVKGITPLALNKLSAIGKVAVGQNSILKAGEKLAANNEAQKGYHVATAIMRHDTTPIQIVAIRNKLTPDQKKGFDLAAAGHVGLVEGAKTPLKDPKSQFAFAATKGVVGATNTLKKEVLGNTLADNAGKAGTIAAATQIVSTKKKHGWWKQFLINIHLSKDE